MYYCEYAGLCDRVMIDVLFWETQSNPVRNDQFFSSLKTSRLLNVKACYFFLINFYGEIYFTERKITVNIFTLTSENKEPGYLRDPSVLVTLFNKST